MDYKSIITLYFWFVNPFAVYILITFITKTFQNVLTSPFEYDIIILIFYKERISMNNRIRAIRKSMNLSQTAFGSKIGVGLGVIKNLEQGKTQLTSPLFELFCNIFNVNPNWLITGEGEMFVDSSNNSSLSSLRQEYDLSDDAIKVIQNFIQMTPNEQSSLIQTLKKLLNE